MAASSSHYLRVMDPTVFGMQFSLDIITAVIVGGLHSVWGGVVGATIDHRRQGVAAPLHQPAWEVVIMGALTVVVLIGFPGGSPVPYRGVYRSLVTKNGRPGGAALPNDRIGPYRPVCA